MLARYTTARPALSLVDERGHRQTVDEFLRKDPTSHSGAGLVNGRGGFGGFVNGGGGFGGFVNGRGGFGGFVNGGGGFGGFVNGGFGGRVATWRRTAAARDALLTAKARAALKFVRQAFAEAREARFQDPKAMLIVRCRQDCADYRAALLALMALEVREKASGGSDEPSCDEPSRDEPPMRVLVAFSGKTSDDL